MEWRRLSFFVFFDFEFGTVLGDAIAVTKLEGPGVFTTAWRAAFRLLVDVTFFDFD